MTKASPQSYAAHATLLAKERKGILQAKFWEARATTVLLRTDLTDLKGLFAAGAAFGMCHANWDELRIKSHAESAE